MREASLLVREVEVERSFESVYVSAWPRVFRYIWVLVRDHHDAEDLTAETFRRAYDSWSREPFRGPDVIPWLLLIARRLVINKARRRALIAWVPLALATGVRDTNDEFSDSEVAAWFGDLAKVLTTRQYEVLVLRYQFDISDREIGRLMNLSEPGVRSLSFRALEALRLHPEVLE
jgi:RNA polymerase sigma-70 factor (ECF subfamily)